METLFYFIQLSVDMEINNVVETPNNAQPSMYCVITPYDMVELYHCIIPSI